ncbi:vanadium-dependent haloperoxidase [Actinoplanes teichomyceticus]|uniref:PAP2 superfamily protein n=1 Tax=Actinoplanes teichomyceticus TaxID=1867 RepID=A0A561WBH9_ACTTI|nr:vanadium-dependent haloperoxidase [Actinoplanes teichomyceticus]TWG21227.1 PAP2 superfamily protein [Actinoplanes teichomyceticus]GIF17071.1 haloperoxidase [Actinoplanes teichomyceticus]
MPVLATARSRAGATLLSAVTIATLGAAAPAAARPVTTDSVLAWYDTTAAAIAAGGAPTQITNNRTWAIAWLAAARAQAGVPSTTGRRAALAGAVHQTLVTLLPGQQTAADATLAAELAALPDRPPVRDAVTAGRAAAQRLIAERTGDGLDPASVNVAFPVPAGAPGIWQPTPPQFAPAAQYGNRLARPFVLRSADQFRPPAPPALDSARYAADLAEVRAYGSASSTVRTQAQTDTATFWLGSSLTLYTPILRAAVEQSPGSVLDRTRLVALFHVAAVDTQIATSDAKYAYQRWRPVTAILAGGDATWLPLHTTPAHPDYPSGHNTYSGSAERVLTSLVGPRARRPYTIGSPTAPDAERTYTDWRQPSLENVDARVWSGIHTRGADLAGIRLGGDVARYVVSHAPAVLN